MALKQEDLFKLDLYELLGLDISCTLQDVKKAFRKKALKCHPDKNPDDPNAAQLFHQLSCALEILSDSSARAAYDKVLQGRKAAKIRHQQLDSRRKKLKEDLEERERQANSASFTNFNNEERKLQAEVERLRKEGSRLLREEISKVQEQIRNNILDEEERKESYVLSVSWQADKKDPDNGGYNSTVLHNLLSKYGEIAALVVSSKKKGKAIVEFRTLDAAISAQNDKGLPNRPLLLERLGGFTKCSEKTDVPSEQRTPTKNVFPSMSKSDPGLKMNTSSFPSKSSGMNFSSLSDEALENSVLEKLRQMERMKRTAEEESANK